MKQPFAALFDRRQLQQARRDVHRQRQDDRVEQKAYETLKRRETPQMAVGDIDV